CGGDSERLRDRHRRAIASPESTNPSGCTCRRRMRRIGALILVLTCGGWLSRRGADACAHRTGREGNPTLGAAGVVHDLIVDPEYRRRRVGRLLLEAALAYFEIARRTSCRPLDCRAKRGSAATLCEHGFPPHHDRIDTRVRWERAQ